jgi:indole-3-glycerol phosphate synthase
MSVLDSIIEGVREDLSRRRKPLAQIHEALTQAPQVIDAHPLLSRPGIQVIAEVKRSSPSKGALAKIDNPAKLSEQYAKAGASVISVLTEERRFGGSLTDLDQVRKGCTLPILRKDFMVDEYQFLEARAHGADVVLLIVAALSPSQLKDFYDLATELKMGVLVEIHTESELEQAMEISPRIIGVNSRNLKTLEVDRQVFTSLLPSIPDEVIKVAESGISTREDVEFAERYGAQAILVGEALVRAGDPISAMRTLLGQG